MWNNVAFGGDKASEPDLHRDNPCGLYRFLSPLCLQGHNSEDWKAIRKMSLWELYIINEQDENRVLGFGILRVWLKVQQQDCVKPLACEKWMFPKPSNQGLSTCSPQIRDSYSQLSPEDYSEQLCPQAHSQTQIQSQQDGGDAGYNPHHLGRRTVTHCWVKSRLLPLWTVCSRRTRLAESGESPQNGKPAAMQQCSLPN